LGTLLGSIFLAMIVTTMAVLRVPGGFQDMIQGILIILVLAVAAAPKMALAGPAAKQPAK
jgi:ribose transport system permease protein